MSKITRSVSIGTLLDKLDVAPPEKTIEDAGFKKNMQKGFRGWARTNHPDKGGDLETFQIISDANDKFRNGELHPSPKTLTKWNLGKQASADSTRPPFADKTNAYAGFSHGTSTPDTKSQKEKTASAKKEEATKAVNRGENIQVVAKRFGITDPATLAHLDSSATLGPGKAAVESGEYPENVAQRMGIKDSKNFMHLFEIAATKAIDHGGSVHAVAAQFGIVVPEIISNLERHATTGPASAAIHHGEHPENVIQRFGITDPKNLVHLFEIAATKAIDQGENIHVVAQRYGIALPEVLANLERHATSGPARWAVQYGEHPQVVAHRLGITNPDQIAYLMSVTQQRS